MRSSQVVKKCMATAVSLALIGAASLVGSGAASAAPAPTDGLVGEYLFSQTTGTTVDNTATGAEAAGDATVINGSDSQWTGTSLQFTGGAKTSSANWVRLPDDLLAGDTSATITTEVKITAAMKSAYNFLWNIGSDSTTSYFFSSVKDATRTAITTSGGGGEVNARSATSLVADRWYNLATVIDGDADTLTYFIDGVQVAQTATTLTPASITDQTVNSIGRSPYPDPFFSGEVAAFRVYDRALSAEDVRGVSESDATVHQASFAAAAQTTLDGISPVTIDDSAVILPSYGGLVSWTSATPAVSIASDGVTATAVLPTAGAAPVTGFLTATATVRGVTVTKAIGVTVAPAAAATDDFGYLMVHFIEDSAGYAEKIYLDVSRGDNPEQWDPLNGGEPILASALGTTGIRDPSITYNPTTQTYYIIATDLRVFGGDNGTGSCTSWCYWTQNASTQLNIWESTDLVTWSEQRQIDVAAAPDGTTVAELGMAWAPEATWVDNFSGDGEGAFVVYWASNVFPDGDTAHTSATYNRVLWGSTTDFTQETFEYGGDFVNTGGNTIDTTMIQDGGTTYRITKDNSAGNGIYLESTQSATWWQPTTQWATLQTKIGAVWAGGNAGGVEGPAVFKNHSEDTWYLYVDVIPSTGYRPLSTTDLDTGFTQLTSGDFSMAPSTKHGGIISLTKAQYDTVRQADAAAAVSAELGSTSIPQGSSEQALAAALPATAQVTLAYARGTSALPVDWDTSQVNPQVAGEYSVVGTVRSIGANLNQWVGAAGSTLYNAPDRVLLSSTAITVTARVVVAPALVVDPVVVPPSDTNTTPSLAPSGSDSSAGIASAPGSRVSRADGSLATTGNDLRSLGLLALVLLVAGPALVLVARRRVRRA